RWLVGEPITVRPAGRLGRLRRWSRRHPVRAVSAIASALLLCLAAVGLTAGYVVVSRAYDEAETHRQAAESHAQALGQRLYVSQMSLAHQHLERGEIVELRTVLQELGDTRVPHSFERRWLEHRASRLPQLTMQFNQH